METIFNLPATVKTYIVARYCDGDLWFWGTWDDYAAAADAACEVHGDVFHRDEVAGV